MSEGRYYVREDVTSVMINRWRIVDKETREVIAGNLDKHHADFLCARANAFAGKDLRKCTVVEKDKKIDHGFYAEIIERLKQENAALKAQLEQVNEIRIRVKKQSRL